MTIEERVNLSDLSIVYTVTLSPMDRVEVPLTEDDRKLLDECASSGKISDKLYALELIARRLEDNGTPIVGVDVAESGADQTAIVKGWSRKDGTLDITSIETHSSEDPLFFR